MFERISTFLVSFALHNAANIPLLQTQLLVCAYVMQILAGWLADSRSYIKLAGHRRDATLIKFK